MKSTTTSSFNYQKATIGFDEPFGLEPFMNPEWQTLMDHLGEYSADELQQRLTKLERILRDDGAVTRQAKQDKTTWPLDAVPWLLEQEDWQTTETGLQARAYWLNQLLIDIYGDQQVVRQGVIPPEAILADPGFLRACVGIPMGEQPLMFYSADLVRNAEGSLQILADRTQALDGAGFALENRSAMSRVFPSAFRRLPMRDLSFFFQIMRYQLYRLSEQIERPTVVLLTSNTRSEYYFEHNLLANFLGFNLVQGRDLTVRNGFVWLKSLDGLSRVDIIVRHINDADCDPAELNGESQWGIPGLLEVVRNHNVSVVNPLGSGVLENPILMKYSDALCQFYTGQAPSLTHVPTYWGFDAQDLQYILDTLPSLVLKPIRQNEPRSLLGSSLSASELGHWRDKIRAHPMSYCAQDFVYPSQLPVWQGDCGFVAKPAVLRTFSFANTTGYQVMPGGLARSGLLTNQAQSASQTQSSTGPQTQSHSGSDSGPHSGLLINFQHRATVKDVWVMADATDNDQRALTQPNVLQQEKGFSSPPSRVVESMFWLGRYMIRAEFNLRLLRTTFVQINNARELPEASYKALLHAVTKVTNTYPGFSAKHPEKYAQAQKELFSIVVDKSRQGSLASTINDMLYSADEVQTLLSSDTQRVLSDLHQEVNGLGTLLGDLSSAPEEALDPLVTSLLALSGLIQESMVRGYGWQFIKLGRLLEACDQTLSLVSALLVPTLNEYDEYIAMESILLTVETLNVYRRRFGANNQVIHGLKLMLTDTNNPRSVAYLLHQLTLCFEALPTMEQAPINDGLSDQQLLIKLNHDLQLANLETLAMIDKKTHTRTHLAALTENLHDLLYQFSTSISQKYFDHIDHQHAVYDMPWVNPT